MRFVRIELGSGPTQDRGPCFARVDGDRAHLFDAAPWSGGAETGEVVALRDEDLLAPSTPSKIICVGRNYAAHAKELGNEVPKQPLLFFKPPSSLLRPGGTIELPKESTRVEHEAELAMIIGRRARRVTPEQAMAHVFGYTIAGDITARDLQKSDGQWTRAKGFDTFCPVGPYLETELDARDVRVTCAVNDVVRQDGRTSQMIFSLADVVSYASQAMTLEPGDLILTGTPEGVGPLVSGDRLRIEITGLGALVCDVRG